MKLEFRLDQPTKSGIFIYFQGILTNRLKLARLVGLSSVAPSEDILLKLYESMGEKAITLLRGEFALVIFDGSQGDIFVVRDPLGVIPVYYQKTGQCLKVSTHLADAIDQLNSTTLHPQWTNAFLEEHYFLTTHTPYVGLRKVPPANFFKVSTEELVNYWTILDEGIESNAKNIEEAGEELFSLVQEAVHVRSRDTSEDVGILLSGGLDSSFIGAVAGNSQIPMRSYSADFIDRSASERWCLDYALKSSFKSKHIEYIDEFTEELYLGPQSVHWPLHYSPNLFLFRPLLRNARDEGVKRMFSGLGGDDVFTPGPAYLSEVLPKNGIVQWINEMKSDYDGIGVTRSIMYSFGYMLSKPRWRRNWSEKKLTGLSETNLIRWHHERDRLESLPLTPLQQQLVWRWTGSGIMPTGMEFEQELARNYGMVMSYPLLDTKILAWAIQQPWNYFVFRGQDKRVLREAASHLLPRQLTTHRSEQDYTQLRNKVCGNQAQMLYSLIPPSLRRKYKNKLVDMNIDQILQFSFVGRLMHSQGAVNERTREKSAEREYTYL